MAIGNADRICPGEEPWPWQSMAAQRAPSDLLPALERHGSVVSSVQKCKPAAIAVLHRWLTQVQTTAITSAML